MRFSSLAIMISPFEVSNRMKFSFPSSKAFTHDSDLPINAVMYADTSSVCSIARLDLIGSPVESQIITPLTPSFSSKRRMIAFTSFTSINVSFSPYFLTQVIFIIIINSMLKKLSSYLLNGK